MKPARILDWPRTHRYDALSNDAETSSQRLFCPDCIIATPGYGFREGQVLEEMRRRKGTSTAEHLKIVLSVIDDWARSQLNHD
jgi:hypothetical protein